MPGYTGHIKGLISENLFASSYGNSTAKAIGKKHPIGHDVEPKERFLSQNALEYKAKKFRRFGKFNILQIITIYQLISLKCNQGKIIKTILVLLMTHIMMKKSTFFHKQ